MTPPMAFPPPPSPALPSSRGKARTADCARCAILRGLRDAEVPSSDLARMCGSLWLSRARRRQILFYEGNRATHLYALRSGRVKLVSHDVAGREHIVNVLGPGSLFGLGAVFGGDYSATAEVLTDAELCVCTREEVSVFLAEAPGFGLSLARYVHSRLDEAHTRQACLGAVGSRARLAAYLLYEARGSEGGVPRDLTLSDYAGILGIAPETVCRALKSFRCSGWIEVSDDSIHVRDRVALERVARI